MLYEKITSKFGRQNPVRDYLASNKYQQIENPFYIELIFFLIHELNVWEKKKNNITPKYA